MPRRSIFGLALISIVLILFTREPPENEIVSTTTSNAVDPVVLSSPLLDEASSKEPNPIRQISILGERNSGTRWTFE